MPARIRSFSWPGNKRLLAPTIIRHLGRKHTCYLEPFGGALGVLRAMTDVTAGKPRIMVRLIVGVGL